MVHGLPDRSNVTSDDERVVVNAGLVLAVTLGRRLGLGVLIDAAVKLGGRPGASRPGRKVLSLMHAMLLGADCIDDCDVLRTGNTEAILGHRAMAPSTLGTFLRSFSFGHVRQLDRVLGQTLHRAWKLGAGPGSGRLVVDVDSFVGEVHGHAKRGAGAAASCPQPALAARAGAHLDAAQPTINPHNDSDALSWPHLDNAAPRPRRDQPKRWIEVECGRAKRPVAGCRDAAQCPSEQ